MPPANSRQAIHAYLEDETFEAWRDCADELGLSVTGLLEALGRCIIDDPDQWDQLMLRMDIVKKARRIDADRRRRGRS